MSSDTPNTTQQQWLTPKLGLRLLLIIAGVIGLLASVELLLEKMRVLADPSYIPSCSLNPILSCTSVMSSPQANAFFGFPNIATGIVGFSVLITIGVGILAGAQYRRWFWIGLQIGVAIGLVFAHWLMVESLYDIGKLCLYCMVIWACVIALFVGITLFNLRTGVFGLSEQARKTFARVSAFGWAIVLIWYAVIFGLIIIRFPSVLSF